MRFKNLRKEMLATFSINFWFSLAMLVPLWFCGGFHNIIFLSFKHNTLYCRSTEPNIFFSVNEIDLRHHLLNRIMKTRELENLSYNNAHNCFIVVNTCIVSFSILELLTYFLYMGQVNINNSVTLLIVKMITINDYFNSFIHGAKFFKK